MEVVSPAAFVLVAGEPSALYVVDVVVPAGVCSVRTLPVVGSTVILT